MNTADLPLSHSICCKICFSIYKQPKLLECFHSFCLTCLQNLQQGQGQTQELTCPSCQECTILPSEGLEGLTDNTIILKSIQRNIEFFQISASDNVLGSPLRHRNMIHQQVSDNPGRKSHLSDDQLIDSVATLSQRPDIQIKKLNSITPAVDKINESVSIESELDKGKITTTVENVTVSPKHEISEEKINLLEETGYGKSTNKAIIKESFQEQQDSKLPIQELNRSNQPSEVINDFRTNLQRNENKVPCKATSKDEQSNFNKSDTSVAQPPVYSDQIYAKPADMDKTTDSAITSVTVEDAAKSIFNNLQQKENLRSHLSFLQSEAINIVHSIDRINEEGFQWHIQKKKLHQRINDRSEYLHEIIQSLERKLLIELETFQQEQEVQHAMHGGKMKLHGILKSILTIADFIRLLLDYGEGEEIGKYMLLINERIEGMSQQSVNLNESSFIFNVPPVNEEEYLYHLFGDIVVQREKNRIWTFEDENDSDHRATKSKVVKSQSLDFPPRNLGDTAEDDHLMHGKEEYHPTSSHFFLRKDLIESHNLSPRHVAGKKDQMRRSSSDMADAFMPSTIPEETTLSQDIQQSPRDQHFKHTPRTSYHQLKSRLGRRYTTGEINMEGMTFPAGHIHGDYSHGFRRDNNTTAKAYGSDLQFNEDLNQAKKVLAMCKKQLLEAKTGVLLLQGPIKEPSALTLHGENIDFKRERFDHLRQSVRHKASKWRYSSGSYDDLL